MEPVGWRSIKAAPTLGSKPEPSPSVFVVFKPSETEGPRLLRGKGGGIGSANDCILQTLVKGITDLLFSYGPSVARQHHPQKTNSMYIAPWSNCNI